MTRPVYPWPVVGAATQLYDRKTGTKFGSPKLENVRASDRLRVQLVLNEAELEAFGQVLDGGRLAHETRTASRESAMAWAEVDQRVSSELVRGITSAVSAKQKEVGNLLSLNDVSDIVNGVYQSMNTQIRTNSDSALQALSGLLLDPATVVRQLFQVDSSAMAGLSAEERAGILAILAPKQVTEGDSQVNKSERSDSSTVEGEVSGVVGEPQQWAVAGRVGGKSSSAEGESQANASERSSSSVAGDLRIFRFNSLSAAATFQNNLRVEILTARGDLQAWPTVSQALTDVSLAQQLQSAAQRLEAEVKASMPITRLRSLNATVIGQRTRVEQGSLAVNHGDTSQYGLDKGKHITGRFEPPPGFSLDSYTLYFFKTLGERDTKGSYVRDGNGVKYEFHLKHGPWWDRWRHEGGISGRIFFSREIKDSVSQALGSIEKLELGAGQVMKVIDVRPETLAGVETPRIAFHFIASEGSAPERVINVELAPGDTKTVEGYRASFVGDALYLMKE